MLQDVRQDLSDVVQVCQGKKKQTNYLRTLISDLVKGSRVTGVLLVLFHSGSSGAESQLACASTQASSLVAGVATQFQPP